MSGGACERIRRSGAGRRLTQGTLTTSSDGFHSASALSTREGIDLYEWGSVRAEPSVIQGDMLYTRAVPDLAVRAGPCLEWGSVHALGMGSHRRSDLLSLRGPEMRCLERCSPSLRER